MHPKKPELEYPIDRTPQVNSLARPLNKTFDLEQTELRLSFAALVAHCKEKSIDLLEGDIAKFCKFREEKVVSHNCKSEDDNFDQLRLLNMLYEGCIKFLTSAKSAAAEKNSKDLANHLNRADAILQHLSDTLNTKVAIDLSSELVRLYDFSRSNIVKALEQVSQERVEEVIGVIAKVYEGFLEIEIKRDAEVFLADHCI